jgi:ABC-2 type transporter
MFDTCLLLSEGGHVAYVGPQRHALPFLGFLGFFCPPGENAADFLLDVIAGVLPSTPTGG